MSKLSLFIYLLFFCGNTLAQPIAAAAPVSVEKVYLHTDRDIYGQGEDIWFKAYVVSGRDNLPATFSRLLYVELINPTAKIVSTRLLRLDKGLGNGDIKLADTISPGSYRLRAYTNWMRNFGDNFIFEKNITILQTSAAPVKTTKDKRTLIPMLPATTATATTTTPTVRFFPEGGAMVSGLSSVVAVRAQDAQGHGLALTGKVTDDHNQAVADFTCDSLGFGAFTLLPDMARHYQALVSLNGQNSRFVLPGVSAEGFTLHTQHKEQLTAVSMAGNEAAFNKARGKQLLLTAKHGGLIRIKKMITLNNSQLLVNIPDELLPEGISVITLSDSLSKPLCERLVYIHHPDSKNIISLTTGKKTYQPKEPVTVRIQALPHAHLSLAAVDAGTVPVQPENIVNYLNLQSEIKGSIEQPNRYFDTTNVNRFKQLDLLLLTQGWRDFVWRRLEDTTLKLSYEPEQGITITGKVRGVWSKAGLGGINITMRAPKAEGQKLFSAITDSAGRFAIYNIQFYGYQYFSFTSRQSGKISTSGTSKGFSGGWLQVDSLFKDTLQVEPPGKTWFTDTLSRELATTAAIEKLKQQLNLKDDHNLKEVKIRGYTDRLPPETHPITLTEQKLYDNLAQYLLYIIDGAKLERYSWKNVPSQYIAQGGSWIGLKGSFADGTIIELGDYPDDQFLSQPMNNILKVTINKNLYGHVRTIDLVVRPGAMETKDFFDNTMADMVGFYKAREFYQPKPEELDSNIDTRVNTIHWEPNITTDSNGEATVSFYNTAQAGNIRLIVQGITRTGTPLVSTMAYGVK